MNQFALEQAIKVHLKQAGLSQAAAARKLHYTPEQFNKWVKGVNRIPDIAIQEFSDLLGLTDGERTELFTLAGYVAVTALDEEVNPESNSTFELDQSDTASRNKTVTINLDSRFFLDALTDWGNHFFRWSEASDHFRSNWTGMVIYTMKVTTSRVTLRGLITLCISILLGMAAIELLSPVLLWPLNNADTGLLVYLQYTLATLLIPLSIAFVTPPDRQDLFQLETIKQQVTFWFLKLAGALVGFWVFSVMIICLALVLYYLHLPPLPTGIRAGLALIPLFFSYLAARRIPVDRYRMFNGQLRLHPADRLFLVVFTLAGPMTAFFLYFSYWFLTNRTVAPFILLIILAGLFIWEYRKQKRVSNEIKQ